MSTSRADTQPSSDYEQWRPIQITLHWLTVGLIILTVAIVLYLVLYPELPPSARGTVLWNLQFYLFNIHYILGLMILATMALRIVLRLIYGSPALPRTVPSWQRTASKIVQALLYVNITYLVVVGLIMIDAGGYYIWWKLWEWPVFPKDRDHNMQLIFLMKEFHFWGAISLLGLVAIHVGAALRHHYVDRDPVLRRMLPARFRKQEGHEGLYGSRQL
jgi:cytochrome b561